MQRTTKRKPVPAARPCFKGRDFCSFSRVKPTKHGSFSSKDFMKVYYPTWWFKPWFTNKTSSMKIQLKSNPSRMMVFIGICCNGDVIGI
jgi:hypothetical protein